jgi:hypothetical protein
LVHKDPEFEAFKEIPQESAEIISPRSFPIPERSE